MNYMNPNKIVFEYYDIHSDGKVTKEYRPEEAITDKTPLEVVSQTCFGKDSVKANSITFSDGNLFIDFERSIYDRRAGSSAESALLDAIADAYLNNVEGMKGIYYSATKVCCL